MVKAILKAVIADEEDVYPGDQTMQVSAQLLVDPKGVEKYMAGFLPGMELAESEA